MIEPPKPTITPTFEWPDPSTYLSSIGLQPIDLILIFLLLLGFALGLARGLRRELFHFILLAGWVALTYGLFGNFLGDITLENAPQLLKHAGIFLLVSYLLTWSIEFAIQQTGFFSHSGIVDRSVGAMFGGGKWLLFLFIGNFIFALHSIDADRLGKLPPFLKDSVFIQYSDAKVEEFYQYLATHGIVTYRKYLKRPETEFERKQRELKELLDRAL